MGRGYPVEQWLEWIEQQKSSGLSITEFCRSIGISHNALYLRRKKLGGQAGAQVACSRENLIHML
jgi:transposase-like protein